MSLLGSVAVCSLIQYGFLLSVIHYSTVRSCFDKLSTNGFSLPFDPFPLALSLSKGVNSWTALKKPNDSGGLFLV
jgi:hypothetical protein